MQEIITLIIVIACVLWAAWLGYRKIWGKKPNAVAATTSTAIVDAGKGTIPPAPVAPSLILAPAPEKNSGKSERFKKYPILSVMPFPVMGIHSDFRVFHNDEFSRFTIAYYRVVYKLFLSIVIRALLV